MNTLAESMHNNVKRIIRGLCGETILGMLDYYRFPTWRIKGTAFNNQKNRQQMFIEIMNCCRPKAIVETGTFRGNTTEFMALMMKIPVHTVEYNKRYYAFAKMRMRKYRNVEIQLGDSREYLRTLIRSGRLPKGIIFFYLDAHWYVDLPLAQEIEIIFETRSDAIVMIDDFQVPWDQGYKYDDYGTNKALIQEYIAPLAARYQLAQFYPSVPSTRETGCKRGCVVLARDTEIVGVLGELPLLRKYC